MVPAAMRPKFVIHSAMPPQAVLDHMDRFLASRDLPVEGRVLSRHMCMTVPREERHFWSPSLDVDVVAEEGGSLLRGYFGPQPNVWTMYLAMYAVLILVAGAAVLIAISQWILGMAPSVLLALPLCLVLAAILYLASLSGQRISASQIEQIRSVLDAELHKLEKSAPPAP